MTASSQLSTSATPMKALVLAGGTGSRLRPLTYALAKQLVPVANRPILWFALDAIVKAGITDIGFIISPETGHQIQASVDEWRVETAPEATVHFIVQDAPKGLAHAVKTAQDFLSNSPFMMFLGDNLIDADLKQWCDAFIAASSISASILLKSVPNPSSFGVATLDDAGQVMQLVEKPKEPPSDLALVGVYLFRPEIFAAIDAIKPSARGELEITDAIQKLIDTNQSVSAQVYHNWWLDTGKKDDLLAANEIVLSSMAEKSPPPALVSGTFGQSTIENVTVDGPVWIGQNVVLRNVTITGPVAIGDGCALEDVVLGAYTSIGQHSHLRQASVSGSVLLPGGHIEGVALAHSLLGHRCQVLNALSPGQTIDSLPTWSVMLADDSGWYGEGVAPQTLMLPTIAAAIT